MCSVLGFAGRLQLSATAVWSEAGPLPAFAFFHSVCPFRQGYLDYHPSAPGRVVCQPERSVDASAMSKKAEKEQLNQQARLRLCHSREGSRGIAIRHQLCGTTVARTHTHIRTPTALSISRAERAILAQVRGGVPPARRLFIFLRDTGHTVWRGSRCKCKATPANLPLPTVA